MGGLDQYGTERFGIFIFATIRKRVGLKGLKIRNCITVSKVICAKIT